jgi:hypothetical protein
MYALQEIINIAAFLSECTDRKRRNLLVLFARDVVAEAYKAWPSGVELCQLY